MANNLSPELLAWLAQQQAPSYGMGQIDPQTGNLLAPQRGQQTKDGTTYIPTSGSQGDGWRTVLSGDPYGKNSSSYYDNAGNYISDAQSNGNGFYDKYLPFVLGAAGLGAGVLGAGAVGGGAAGVPGAGDAFMPGALGPDGLGAAEFGGGVGSGTGAGTGLLQGSSAGMTAPAGLGSSAGLGGASVLGGAGGMTPGLQAAIDAAGAVGGGSSLLGLGATALGALAGAQPQKTEATTNKDLPAWLQPYVTNMAGKADNLLNQQMSPEAQAKWLQMQAAGQSLLAQPVAGNGYGTIKYGR